MRGLGRKEEEFKLATLAHEVDGPGPFLTRLLSRAKDIHKGVRGVVPHHRCCGRSKSLTPGEHLVYHTVKRVLVVLVIEVIVGEHAVRDTRPWVLDFLADRRVFVFWTLAGGLMLSDSIRDCKFVIAFWKPEQEAVFSE